MIWLTSSSFLSVTGNFCHALNISKMENYFATFALVFSFLAVACTALDVTVESVENHSPFSEQTDRSRSNENTVFTKEELAKYNGEDVGLSYITMLFCS